MIRMLLAIAAMMVLRWAIALLSPVRNQRVSCQPVVSPYAYRRAGACLALYRLRCRISAWGLAS